MTIEYPANIKEVVDRTRTDVKNTLPASNPFQVKNSFLNALVVGVAGRSFDIYDQIRALQDEAFPDTATGDFLERWGSYKNISRNAASQSKGFVSFTGTASTTIPAATEVQSQEGEIYSTDADVTISSQVLTITSLTRSAQTVTVTTASEHHWVSGIDVTFAGAVETEYNGTYTIVSTGLNTGTYTITGTPTTPATGTITGTAIIASASVTSTDFGANTNIAKDSEVNMVTPVAGVNNAAFVQHEGLTGGEDIESDEDFRARILDRYRNPISNFNVAQIVAQAKLINGVTNVEVQEITPSAGQVTIYPLRYNDEDPIPDSSEISTIKDKILEIKPAHVDPDDVIVLSATPVVVDFKFNELTPNTNSMQQAIINNLEEVFREKAVVGESFLRDAYRSAIFNTVDTSTGEDVVSFALQIPTNNIAINAGELAILGAVDF